MRKIQVIQILRLATGCSLREAKFWAEAYLEQYGNPRLSGVCLPKIADVTEDMLPEVQTSDSD
jgi:hypothetical protein